MTDTTTEIATEAAEATGRAAALETESWDSEDWAAFNGHPDDANHYVSVTGNVVRRCPRCGYEGTASHPRRNRPTIEAPLYHDCPDAECGATLSTADD